MKTNRWYPSTTRRYRVPEGTVFVSVASCDGTPFVQVFAGKVGTPLFALGSVNAALAGLALQQGASYDEVLEVLDVTHEKSNGKICHPFGGRRHREEVLRVLPTKCQHQLTRH